MIVSRARNLELPNILKIANFPIERITEERLKLKMARYSAVSIKTVRARFCCAGQQLVSILVL